MESSLPQENTQPDAEPKAEAECIDLDRDDSAETDQDLPAVGKLGERDDRLRLAAKRKSEDVQDEESKKVCLPDGRIPAMLEGTPNEIKEEPVDPGSMPVAQMPDQPFEFRAAPDPPLKYEPFHVEDACMPARTARNMTMTPMTEESSEHQHLPIHPLQDGAFQPMHGESFDPRGMSMTSLRHEPLPELSTGRMTENRAELREMPITSLPERHLEAQMMSMSSLSAEPLASQRIPMTPPPDESLPPQRLSMTSSPDEPHAPQRLSPTSLPDETLPPQRMPMSSLPDESLAPERMSTASLHDEPLTSHRMSMTSLPDEQLAPQRLPVMPTHEKPFGLREISITSLSDEHLSSRGMSLSSMPDDPYNSRRMLLTSLRDEPFTPHGISMTPLPDDPANPPGMLAMSLHGEPPLTQQGNSAGSPAGESSEPDNFEKRTIRTPPKSRRSYDEFQLDEPTIEKSTISPNSCESSKGASERLDIHEKLREMGEISVKPVSKTGESSAASSKPKEEESEVSLEIKKKAADLDAESKRITNLRKNIREVMDENQLDATTLAAQRQESERLARVQVQQKVIRELQRQMAVERQNNRTQNRVLSLLQGQTSILKSSSAMAEKSVSLQPHHSAGSASDMYIVKGVASEVTFKGSNFVDVDKLSSGNLTPSVSIAPVRRTKSFEDSDISDEESEGEEDSDKKEVVEIVDSSSDDDCIVLSDDEEEEEEPEDDPHNSGLHVKDAYNIPDEQGRVLINIGHPENEADLFLAPQIARVIKPHQIGGVRFLYDNIIESTDRFDTSTGFGCILAHSMGLGKTLQVVSFCDIFLRHTNSKSILCILPINTLQNWMSEFNMWLPEDPEKSPFSAHGEVRPRNFRIFVLNDQQKTLSARSKVILEWAKSGGVLLIGYELFRLLSLKLANKKKKGKKGNLEKEKAETEAHKRLMEDIHSALVRPGPDLVMCDEGHRIKNSHASISVALKQIRSKRRIVLTGYPLQNNLLEYWCMVDFVRPNYLGTKTEFSNMFERPIQNGQCIDSTPQDIKLMRYRAHVLHSLLVGFVQRRSHVVLQNSLPQKEEYVILVRMTSFQRKLYNTFMNEVVRTKAVPNPLKAFAVCCKIWNHPDVLYNFLKKREADLDLELEEVEPESNPATPAANNRGRKKGTPNKATKGINKNGKTIPAVEVQPNQGKLPAQATDTSAEESSPTVDKSDATSPLDCSQTSDTASDSTSTTAPAKPPAIASQTALIDQKPQMNDLQPNSFIQSPAQNHPDVASNNGSQPTDNGTSQPAPQYPPQPAYNYPPQPMPIPNPPHQHNYNPYNPYEYENYYGGQFGNMYPPPPQQYPNNPYEQPYMANPQNNYWQNNYYSYNNNSNSMNMDPYGQTDPSYASLVPKATESFDNSKPPSAEEKSSEIVDLDTKEIKTVEATIVKEEAKETNEPAADLMEVEDESKENIKKIDEDTKGVIEIKDDKSETNEKKEKLDVKEESVTLEKEKDPPRASAKDDGIPYDWAVELMKGYVPDLLENSPKMVIFFRLLEESVKMGDRILVFSQSLLTLNLVERFLQKNLVPGCDYHWAKNTTYFRLDGSTSAIEREKLINEFNANPHIHLFLVSTRAGSLGINLVGANRVVVFDASWNPCHDTQAVCRVYRYGQKKPCFVYRIVMDNCLEKKIYDRQINKQGMSDRVVDECNPDAHLSMKEVTNLCYDNEEDGEVKDFSECKDKYLDVIMQKIMELHSDLLSKEPFHHESLLVDRKEKKLSQAEKRLAQRGYEMEKRAAAKPAYVYHSMGTQYRIMKTPDGSIVHRPVASVRPMQAEAGDKGHITRPGGVRPTRWIPAEVWQRQGMTAQEMTLPLDVVIPTSSGDKSNIVLKAGQKVMVLKSPKGIYMQLETGKIIAIRTSFKMGQNQSKEKVEESDASSSNLTNSDDMLTKSALKGDEAPSQVTNNSGASNITSNLISGKQNFVMEGHRSGKITESAMPTAPYKANNMMQSRNFPTQHNTNNSKNFNVQNLIEGKVSSGNQNASIYSHAKGADILHPESNRAMNSSGSAVLNKANLYNTATKANYPRSNYSFTNALKQAQTHGNQQSLLANVKPQMHENKMWESAKSQGGKNVEANLPTITIDDDIEPPLREKVVYKPNLIERKVKHSAVRNMLPNASVSANYGKQMHSRNALPQTQTSGNFKGSESMRQLQNVKPYNRQYADQRNGSTSNKSSDESAQSQTMSSAGSASHDAKSSGSRGKMPSIRNIPAPFPSVCMASSSKAGTQSSMHNTPSYSQSSISESSHDNGSSYSSGQSTQQNKDNGDYTTMAKSSSQHTTENAKSDANVSDKLPADDKNQSQSNPPTSKASPQTQPPASNSSLSHANSDPQYSSYSHPQQNPNSFVPNETSSYNYSRSDLPTYQQPYPDMYASGPPNPYGYPPATQPHPPPQSGYPYASYYDHQMYGNSSAAQNYGGSATAPPPSAPPQYGQYHYPNYQPSPAAPPQSADPYNSYYNYPPYPPQAGQWQQ